MIDPKRKYWNEQQQKLNKAVQRKADHELAVELFLGQHGMVHTAEVSQNVGLWSFEDEVWDGLSDAAARRVPGGFDHSIAWMLWHTTRCEDITFNLLVAGGEQVLTSGGWLEKMKISVRDTGNTMSEEALAKFNSEIDLAALRSYRCETARRTREIVRAVAPGGFKEGVLAERAARIMAERAVVEEARGLVDYWVSRTIGGLLLMPATRHHIVHLNEAMRVKGKIKGAAK
jgi:hypothetical protein